jgi:glyoxylase-like metal-dependent hydrolase (beta-lactamase superfamily II)
LVDTLWFPDAQLILEQIQRIGRSVTDLKHIILTHGHRSHLGGLAELKRLSDATVYAHEWEADIIAGERRTQGVTLKPRRPYVLIPHQFAINVGIGTHTPCPVDHAIAGGDRVGPLDVVDAPGHSPGHLAFRWPDRSFLIVGDAVSTWPEFDAGWPAFNLNWRQHRQTLRQFTEFEPQVVGVGHGPPITAGARERLRSLVERYDA